MMSAVNASSSARPFGVLRCVERCWPRHPAGKALRNGELQHDMVDAATATGRAQKFPEAASFRISFSSVRSDTALRSRSFSFSRSLRRFT